MFSLLFLEKMRQYWRQRSVGSVGTETQLLTFRIGEKRAGEQLIEGAMGAEGYDPASANDRSYEDALLDLEIHSFMQAEYGAVEPPPGVLCKIKLAIEERLQRATLNPGTVIGLYLSKLFSGFYRALTGPTTSRIAPGALAFMVAITILGGDATRILRESMGVPNHLPFDAPALMAPTPQSITTDQATSSLATSKDEAQVNVRASLSRDQEVDVYDPIYLRTLPIVWLDKANSIEHYDASRFGPN